MNNLVSVIIPTHNREKTIIRAINSALNQTYREIEVIVVDDCSNDNTPLLVNNVFGKDSRVIFHRLDKNGGACVARNKGVQISNGKYVAFLDSDDEFLPDKISKQIDHIQSNSISLCASDYTIVRPNGKKILVCTHSGSKEEVYKSLLYCNFVTTGTLIGYRECFINVPFDETLPRYQDWDIILRLCKKYKIDFIHESTLLQYSQTVSITTCTNHEKSHKALTTVYTKNLDGYKSNRKAYGQIHWLMGIHGLFVKGSNAYKHLLIGATIHSINFKRIGVIILSLFDKSIINRNY